MDLIGPYTLKGKDKTEIDFMCLTMIDPATSWLEIVELPVVDKPTIPTGTWGRKGISTYGILYLWSHLVAFYKWLQDKWLI